MENNFSIFTEKRHRRQPTMRHFVESNILWKKGNEISPQNRFYCLVRPLDIVWGFFSVKIKSAWKLTIFLPLPQKFFRHQELQVLPLWLAEDWHPHQTFGRLPRDYWQSFQHWHWLVILLQTKKGAISRSIHNCNFRQSCVLTCCVKARIMWRQPRSSCWGHCGGWRIDYGVDVVVGGTHGDVSI